MSTNTPETAAHEIIDEQIVRLAAEVATVRKTAVETGHVTVRVTPKSTSETIEVSLTDTHAEVERVPVGRYVDAYPDVRREGDVTIIPVVDEHPVIVTRLFLREEIRLTLSASTRTERRVVTLRSEEADVQRVPSHSQPSNEG